MRLHDVLAATGRRHSRIFILGLIAVALVLAGCGGAQVPMGDLSTLPAASQTESPSAPSSPSPSPTDTPSSETELPSPSPTAEPSSGPGGTSCEDGPTITYLDSVWTEFIDEEVAFLYPKHWTDLSGAVRFRTGDLISEETLLEMGVDPEEKMTARFVRSSGGFPNFSVFRFENVLDSEMDLNEVYAREEERFSNGQEVTEVVQTEIEACLDAVPALGLAMWFSRDAEQFYQRSYFILRDGALYHVQWLSGGEGGVEVLDEMLGSWHWATAGDHFESDPSNESEDGSSLLETHVTATVPTDDEADPDPATFAHTLPADADHICAVFLVDVDVPDTLAINWYHEGQRVFEDGADFGVGHGWAWVCIETTGGTFDTGNWAVFVEFAGSGDRSVESFKVVE